MAGTTATTRTLKVIGSHSVVFNDEAEDFPYEVWCLDDNDALDCHATEAEAVEDAARYERIDEDQRREDRLESLRDKLNDLVGACEDEAALEAILAMLAK